MITRALLIGAALLGGLLAGLDVDRAIVAMPAWQQVGVAAWAEFSRHADLGNGLVLYPLQAIRTTTEPEALRRAFEDFLFWGDLRGLCHAFAAQL